MKDFTNSSVVLLAAGLGTRMKSGVPKVLHAIAGLPMIDHVIEAARESGSQRIAVVVSPLNAEEVKAKCRGSDIEFYEQSKQLGTADAVLAAAPHIETCEGFVFVLYGDTPLVTAETLGKVRETLATGADLAVLAFKAADPTGYGRLLIDSSGALTGIREERDASAAERQISLCNSGIMGFRAGLMLPVLRSIENNNAKGEYYLTDAVSIAHARGLRVAYLTCPEEEVLGVNDRSQLAAAEGVMQQRLRRAAMLNGATLIDPASVTFAWDTQLGTDVTVEPNVFFGPGVTVEDGAVIRAFSHIESARVGRNAVVGPFARLRPGAKIGAGAHIGNYVEIKNATVHDGAKINHLSYIGDATVGAAANVGAGTITCNYDGVHKHHTGIGAGAFIGSNTALVAPVQVGDGAYVGAGSTITRDVPPDSLAVTRARQVEVPGWAEKTRKARAKKNTGSA